MSYALREEEAKEKVEEATEEVRTPWRKTQIQSPAPSAV